MIHHYITQYSENGKHYAEAWIQIAKKIFIREATAKSPTSTKDFRATGTRERWDCAAR